MPSVLVLRLNSSNHSSCQCCSVDVRAGRWLQIWKGESRSLKTNATWRESFITMIIKPPCLYGAETSWTTVNTAMRIHTCFDSCLRRILGIRWSEIISHERLWQRTCHLRCNRRSVIMSAWDMEDIFQWTVGFWCSMIANVAKCVHLYDGCYVANAACSATTSYWFPAAVRRLKKLTCQYNI